MGPRSGETAQRLSKGPGAVGAPRAECSAALQERAALEDAVKRQDDIITKQESELERQNGLIKELEAQAGPRSDHGLGPGHCPVLRTERTSGRRSRTRQRPSWSCSCAQGAPAPRAVRPRLRAAPPIPEKRATCYKKRVWRSSLSCMVALAAHIRGLSAECPPLRSGTTKLAIFFGEPWLVTRSRHRLYGELPRAQPRRSCGALHCVAGATKRLRRACGPLCRLCAGRC